MLATATKSTIDTMQPNPETLDLRSEFMIPEGAIKDPVIGQELTFCEEVSEETWLAPILSQQDVIEIGCNVGLRAAFLSQVANRVVCTDTEAKRRVFAKQTISINRISNTVVVDDLMPEDLSRGDVLLINSRRPIPQKHIDAIHDRPTSKIVVLGPLSKELAQVILGAGYSHCAEFPRGAVFCAQSS